MLSKLVSSFILVIFFSSGFVARAENHLVNMKSLSFDPKIVEIKSGDTVEWTNVALTDHSATGADFDTGLLKPKNNSKKIPFAKAGTWDYHCSLHGKSMSGQVVVKP